MHVKNMFHSSLYSFQKLVCVYSTNLAFELHVCVCSLSLFICSVFWAASVSVTWSEETESLSNANISIHSCHCSQGLIRPQQHHILKQFVSHTSTPSLSFIVCPAQLNNHSEAALAGSNAQPCSSSQWSVTGIISRLWFVHWPRCPCSMLCYWMLAGVTLCASA